MNEFALGIIPMSTGVVIESLSNGCSIIARFQNRTSGFPSLLQYFKNFWPHTLSVAVINDGPVKVFDEHSVLYKTVENWIAESDRVDEPCSG